MIALTLTGITMVPPAQAKTCAAGTSVCYELATATGGFQVSFHPRFPLPVVAEVWQAAICPGPIQSQDESLSPTRQCDPDELIIPYVVVTAPGGDPCGGFEHTPVGCSAQSKQDLYTGDFFDSYCVKSATLRLWYNNQPNPDLQVPGLATLTTGSC